MNRHNFNKKNKAKEVEYIPQGSEEALATAVESLDLHPKTKELFAKNNINTVYDIAKRNSKQLFKIQGFGKKDLIGVERELSKLNITLAPLPEEPQKVEEKVEKTKKVLVKEDKPVKQDKPIKEEKVKQDKPKQEKVKQDKKVEPKQNKPNDKAIQPKDKQKKQDKPNKAQNEYARISKGEKFGISKGGQVVIPAMYDEVFMVKEGMACVDVDGLFGYVNLNNEMVIEPKYELAQSFSEGLANVMLNDKYGYIDKTGKVVIDFKYELATPFEEDGTARVKLDGRWASITKEEKITWI